MTAASSVVFPVFGGATQSRTVPGMPSSPGPQGRVSGSLCLSGRRSTWLDVGWVSGAGIPLTWCPMAVHGAELVADTVYGAPISVSGTGLHGGLCPRTWFRNRLY